jgi:polygalacturonase
MLIKKITICLCLILISSWVYAQTNVMAPSNPGVYNVKEYGATGNGKTLDSPSINKAIETCAEAGGGTVYFPAGTYLSGSIHLKSNVNLFLDAGSVILGAPQDMNAYDPSEEFNGRAFQDGGHTYFHNSLIWGENIENVFITGYGMINGGGLTRKDKGVGEGSIGLGDKAIALKNCRNVLFDNFTIFHGGHFAILVTGCTNMTINNITIDTDRDGMDIDCCKNVMVSNCRVNSPNDDGICPKSTYALHKRIITENLTITNCQVSGFKEGTLLDGTMVPSKNATGRIKFGTESDGGFRNITISNCTFRDCRGLALEEVDGGIMQNITINNISMMNIKSYPIYITLGKRNRAPDSTVMGVMKNIIISNVIATGVDSMSGVQVTGLPGDNIEHVRLQNIWITYKGGGTKAEAERTFPELGRGYPEPHNLGVTPAYGLFARHVNDLQMDNIRFSYEKEDARPAMICDDINGLQIDDFKAETGSGIQPAKFQEVKELVVRNSPELK